MTLVNYKIMHGECKGNENNKTGEQLKIRYNIMYQE